MTNGQVKDGFSEVYNQFWNKYKKRQPDKESPEWERAHTYAVVLMKKYPFMRETIAELLAELDRRMRHGP